MNEHGPVSDMRRHIADEHGQRVALELNTRYALETLHTALHAITDPDPESVRDD